jgi:peroxiredoxin
VNLPGSIFIAVFPVYLAATSIHALVQLARGADPLLAWLGVSLAALGPLAFFAWVLLAKPARTARHPVEYSVVSALGLGVAMVAIWRYGDGAGQAHIWAGVSVIAWFCYLRWYSRFPNRKSPALATGHALPEFNLQSTLGEIVNSSLFRGNPHVLVFYRGNWCPFCVGQIHELARQYRDLQATGARVVFISSQPLERHRKLAERYGLPLQFLRDPDNAAARKLGILARWGTPMGLQLLGYGSDTALPTTLITDEAGVIVWSHQTDNYRIRPEPRQFMTVLAALRGRGESGHNGR